MRVVSLYRPFVPESREHLELGPFNWCAALQMLSQSVRLACGCDVVALTDWDTPLPMPALRYHTTQSRLMLWLLEIALRYLESDAFDRDTVMVSPDMLVFNDLRPYFGDADVTVLVRSGSQFAVRPILNGAQWWPIAGKRRLIGFYRDALATACALPEPQVQWGADTEGLRVLLAPIGPGKQKRHGLRAWLLESNLVLQSLTQRTCEDLDAGRDVPLPTRPILDFKYTRKRYMAPYFAATLGRRLEVA